MAVEHAPAATATLVAQGPGRWRLDGCLTIEHARAGLAAIEPLLERAGVQSIDASGLAEFDSAALAVMFDWERRAHARGLRLAWAGLPPGLLSLARLYGVESMLAAADAEG
jgi:phospholipid transport system transporter-binding protein